jgi:hypothetical protein
MDRDKIIDAIRRASENNQLSCEKAHELSRVLEVPLQEIGAICNDVNIRPFSEYRTTREPAKGSTRSRLTFALHSRHAE